ncbi:branched-chain amino acid ABC transporter permease [Agromyces mangrovi Wang et al. 2018]|uniref:branched-chain amino acid ABC transporter permease n=1 Tax=Agromyces mangrovi TaxID=1858653 RepID=UPI002573D308|nr:branched-chain amino acid ABC transporter permease [Agromyces mangrovi]BDZ63583.1 branched-chain amino acid ABC transporter permease [Agromyces mangrovi]
MTTQLDEQTERADAPEPAAPARAPRITPVEWLRTPRPPLALSKPVSLALGAAGVVALAIVPFVNPSWVNLHVALVLIFAIVAMGLNLLVGMGGQVSLGHAAFFAVGAYTTAVVGAAGVPAVATLPLAGAVAFAIGWLFGIPALRLQGLQLGLVTLALALVTPPAIRQLDEITRGSRGIGIDGDAPAWIPLDQDQWVLLLALVVFVLAWIATARFARGRLGRSFVAIRDAELVAETLGVAVQRTKVRLFATSAAYAGVGGGLYAMLLEFIGPENFGLTLSISFITMIVVGGIATVPGAVLGAAFVQAVPAIAGEIDPAAAGFTYGVVLLLFVFFVPFGLIGVIRGALRPLVDRVPWLRPRRLR